MSNFKYFTTFILVFGFIGCECADIRSCHENKISYEWQPQNNSQPAEILAIELFPKVNEIYKNVISISLIKRQENFNLTVLVKPFVKNQTQCPPDPNTEIDLRKFYKQYRWEMGGEDCYTTVVSNDSKDDRLTCVFEKAFTGCYYFIMTNDRNQHWLTDLRYYRTNQFYFDTMLRCNATYDYQTNGHENCTPGRLEISFRIPLRCLKLEIKLFELEDKDPDTLEKCQSNEIPAKKVCWLTLKNCNGAKATVSQECNSSEDTVLESLEMFDPSCGKEDNSWNVHIYWSGLNASGAYYYSTFSQTYPCIDARISDFDLWVPATKLDIINHHWINDTECKPPESSEKKFNFNIIYITVALIPILILIYCIGKLIKNCLHQNKFRWLQSNIIISAPEEESMCDADKSTNILLVYARDSDEFKKAVDALRSYLKEKCCYQIRDIYSNNELQNVSKLTVPVWIEKMMRSRCKIVFIDTPKLRSRLNDDELNGENLHNDDAFDFRDTSVRYAVNLAKNTFENTTQYCRHFVLRINGFDEFNGVKDPLETIAPHVRFHYPEHFDELCEHLNK